MACPFQLLIAAQVPAKNVGPAAWLIFGIFFIGLAVVGMLSGESFERYGRVVYRAKEPKRFWESIVSSSLCGALLIGAYAFNARADYLINVLFAGAFVYILYLLTVYLRSR